MKMTFLSVILCLIVPMTGHSSKPDLLKVHPQVEFEAITPRMEVSIAKSLKWLASQQREDGFYNCGVGNRVGYGYDVHVNGSHVGVTAIAGMAFLANGHVPGIGPYGTHVEKIVEAIITATQDNGYVTFNGSRMYSHAFATLFLAEVFGMTGNKKVRKALSTAVELIIDNQNKSGGWRYNLGARDSDLSVVVCLVQALRAANNAGIYVPRSVIDNSLKYIKKMVYKPTIQRDNAYGSFGRRYSPHVQNEGGFYYQEMGRDGHEERVTFAICAAGVTALHGTGIYEGRELEKGYTFLKRRYIDRRFSTYLPAYEGYAVNRGGLRKVDSYLEPGKQSFQFFYGHYYAVQAFHQKGGHDWKVWFSRIRSDILEVQKPDGRYVDEVGESYATAMATLILSLPKGYLPIFQR